MNNNNNYSNEILRVKREAQQLEIDISNKLNDLASTSRVIQMKETVLNNNTSSFATKRQRYNVLVDTISQLLIEIERLIQEFSEISTKEEEQSIFIRRYQDVLRDAKTEFHQIKHNTQQHIDRTELFSNDLKGNNNNSLLQPRTEMLLSERTKIQETLQMTDALLSDADNANMDLRETNMFFTSMSDKLASVVVEIPGINQVMNMITWSRHRDNIILSFVIASCILFTLFYIR